MKLIHTLIAALLTTAAYAQPDTSYRVYFGLLHAHTMTCDGSGTPEEAYAMAKGARLHFFAVTPHNHAEAESGAKERKDDVLIAKRPELYNGASNVTVTRKLKENGGMRTEQVTMKPLLRAAKDATDNRFIGLYGQEFSTISSGNHVNVLGINYVLKTENGNFSKLVAELATITGEKPVIQLNHPEVEADLFYSGTNTSDRNKMYNDYGIDAGDLGPHFADWVRAMQPYSHLIEVLSGPAMEENRVDHYHYNDNANDYYFYLSQGLHISPSAGQDNHYKTWGTVTDARMGVVAKSLSQAALFDAFRRHRTFASEDKNLRTVLYVNDSMMGATVKAHKDDEVRITIHIADADEPNATYDVSIYTGIIHPQLSTQATNAKAAHGLVIKQRVQGNGLHKINGFAYAGDSLFCYAKVQQTDGDRAWTAPVWINLKGGQYKPHTATQPTAKVTGSAKYYWTSTSSSKVYHAAGCSGIAQIKPDNLRSGDTPPAGRHQHKCDVR
jgi:hypothetical protein